MPLLFHGRHLWSPVGLGYSTRLAQEADSLCGERVLTPPLGLNALRCGRLACFVTLQASLLSVQASEWCWRDCCRCQSKPISAMYFITFSTLIAFDKKSAGLWLVPTFFTSLRAVSRGTGPQYPSSSQGLGDALCQWPLMRQNTL